MFWIHVRDCENLQGAKMQCWKGEKKELRKLFFYIVGIAPLHLRIFLSIFWVCVVCERIVSFLFQLLELQLRTSEFSQSVLGFGSV